MEILITIVILVFLVLMYFYYENTTTENYCNQNDENSTHALLAPNIPVDPQTRYRIGGKYCKPLSEKNIVPESGKYEFIKEKLLYDGIWNDDRKIEDDIEVKEWKIKKPIGGVYASNKFLHLPERIMTEDTIDKDIYFPDWNRLEIRDRNMYNFDVCDYNKSKNHRKNIMYIEAGI